ncbi:MAG: lipopolysaccharide biosynthesis protein [Crocinitomicaceae bacterium]|nr:lipopolysaccharide biosynthesis protein [Crocinitomicaceae bacterium]
MLKGLKKRISNSDFLKSLAILMTGTIIAQAIGYLLAPIITRLFTPEEMGEFGIFQRLTAFIATIATARYEFALPLPKKDKHAFLLFRYILRLVFITVIITLLGAIIYGISLNKELDYYILVIALVAGVTFLVFFNLGTNWAIRLKEFHKISLSKMSNSLSLNGLRVFFGLIGTGSIGLIISFVISLFIGSLHFVKDFISRNKLPKTKIAKQKGYLMVREYKDFPLANLPHALSDNLRDLLVAFIIIDLFSENMFGSFDHSFRMLRIPIMIIGASMSQVFFNRISDYKKQAIQIYPLFKKLLMTLILLSIAPFSIIYFFGGEIFSFVFGDEWYLSGKLSEIMAPWLMLNFILSPLSTIPLVFNKQKQFFVLGLIASILQLGGFFILPVLFKTHPDKIFYVFSIVSWLQVILSILIIYYLYTIVKQHDSKVEKI